MSAENNYHELHSLITLITEVSTYTEFSFSNVSTVRDYIWLLRVLFYPTYCEIQTLHHQ